MTDESSFSGDASVQRMCDLVTSMATALADQPEQVRVEADEAGSEVALRLFVSENDLGKLIGKGGRTARALRNILNAAGSKQQRRFSLDIQSA